EGEFLTILGESGSGKTTLLRIIAGFETANSGELWMGSERLDGQPPYRRRVNTVFQHYALFPHLTVEQNVAYGLRVANRPEAEPHLYSSPTTRKKPWSCRTASRCCDPENWNRSPHLARFIPVPRPPM